MKSLPLPTFSAGLVLLLDSAPADPANVIRMCVGETAAYYRHHIPDIVGNGGVYMEIAQLVVKKYPILQSDDPRGSHVSIYCSHLSQILSLLNTLVVTFVVIFSMIMLCFLSPPVLMHGGLFCIAVRLSVTIPKVTR